jgi:putative transposase
MDGSIRLQEDERNDLLDHYRRSPDPAVRLRAHLILLLADGWTWATIGLVLFTSSSTIRRWQQRFREGGVDALLGRRRGRRSAWAAWWAALVTSWVLRTTPRDFGFYRSRWTCATLVLVIEERHGVGVSGETVRRWLHQQDLVWRRPRPVLGPRDCQREAKLRALRALLAQLPDDEVAVFEDEVDINTNPKIGSMWMRRGAQAEVLTPGNNDKRYLAGSLNWRTGQMLVTLGGKRDGALFERHLDDLRRRLRRYRVIHVICDNARFHKPERCRRIAAYLKQWGHRIVLHFLPTYAPETNPIERVWWHLHEEITRNHRCRDMQELLDLVFAWLENRSPFAIETSTYEQKNAA